jgi:hypothetical protein
MVKENGMTRRVSTQIIRPTMFLAVVAAVLQPLPAQTADTLTIRSITRYTLKSDRTGDMAAAIKEYNELLKKAHWDRSYTIWRSATGPGEMVRVDYYSKWADLDANVGRDPKMKEYQADLARITTRINESFVTTTRIIDVVNQKASLPSPAEMPKMISVWTAHVKQDKMREAVDLETNEYAPAVKAAGLKVYAFAVTRYGGPANEIRSTTGMDNWATFDQANPVRKAMGDDKYRAFSAKMDPLLEDYRYDVYRYDAELSYTAAK